MPASFQKRLFWEIVFLNRGNKVPPKNTQVENSSGKEKTEERYQRKFGNFPFSSVLPTPPCKPASILLFLSFSQGFFQILPVVKTAITSILFPFFLDTWQPGNSFNKKPVGKHSTYMQWRRKGKKDKVLKSIGVFGPWKKNIRWKTQKQFCVGPQYNNI